MLLARTKNFQLFGYLPSKVHQSNRRQTIGLAARVRARNRWRYFTGEIYWPRRDLRLAMHPMGRGVLSFELATWLKDGKTGERLTVKTFFRVKIGMGGRRIAEVEDQAAVQRLPVPQEREAGLAGKRQRRQLRPQQPVGLRGVAAAVSSNDRLRRSRLAGGSVSGRRAVRGRSDLLPE